MNYDASLWLIFILIGLATTLPRAMASAITPIAGTAVTSLRPCHEIRGCHLLAAWLHCSAFAI